MKKPRKLVVGNWKMGPANSGKAKEIFLGVRKAAKNLKYTDVVVCPPYLYINQLKKLFTKGLALGAQDVFSQGEGSHTGAISAEMLREADVEYVIIGHSERRALGETDEFVNQKIKEAIRNRLEVILCIGEEVRDEEGNYLELLRNQIKGGLSGLPKRALENVIVAYEPVWAIGKKEAMEPSQLHEMSIFIKKALIEHFNSADAGSTPILYGGSVTPANASQLITGGEVSGLLVGRESLNPLRFGEILALVDALYETTNA